MMSNKDDVEIKVAVVDYLVYELEGSFLPHEEWTFLDRSVSFPCFREETLLLQMIEYDDATNDFAQVQVDCVNLQPGYNGMILRIKED